MTITYVGAGTATTGNNTSVTPGAISGIAAGDLVLILASIRNSGTGSVNAPAGWTFVTSAGASGAIAVLGRFWQTGDAMPSVTFAAGVANADTIARGIAFRGVAVDALVNLTSSPSGPGALNSSAQNIAYPALDLPGAGQAVVIAVWKQDDATAYTTPSGFTAVGLTSTTTGDDASQALYYKVETTEADIVGGAITVTGGAAAISAALLLGLKPAAAIAATVQDVYPPRVQVLVNSLTIGDQVDVYRVVAGVRTLLRGGHTDATIDAAFIVVDAELPFGVPVSYVAVVDGIAEYATGSTTYTLPGGKVAITDAITGRSAEVSIGADGGKTNGRDSARMRVAGRNVVVTGPPGQDEGSYELLAESTTAYAGLIDLLENATEATVQIRQPGGYDGVDAYVVVDSWATRRLNQDGKDEKRLVTIEYAETQGWAPQLEAAGFTLGDIADFFGATATLNDIATFVGPTGTLLDIAKADWSS